MKVISIDIETTGIDRENCQILEIGAVIFDTKEAFDPETAPKFKCIVDNGKDIQGEPYAINMNARIFEILAGVEDLKDKKDRENYRIGHNIIPLKLVSQEFWEWLYINNIVEYTPEELFKGNVKFKEVDDVKYSIPVGKVPRAVINACGKNFGTFDLQFLERLPSWNRLMKVRTRILDPAILAFNNDEDDSLPGMQICFERTPTLKDKIVSHDALEDAIDTAEISIFHMNRLGMI